MPATPIFASLLRPRAVLAGAFLFAATASSAGTAGQATAPDTRAAVLMFNTLPVRPEALAGFLPVMRANVAGSRAEPGNISFDVYQREEGGSDLFLVERWRDQAALDAHMKTPHLRAVAGAAPRALAGGETSVRLRELSDPAPWPAVTAPGATRNLVVSLQVKPERRAALLKALLDTVAPSRAAPGNLGFDVYEAANDSNTLVIVERWTNPAAHEAHLAQPYNAPLNAIFEDSLARPLGEGRRLLRDVSDTPTAGKGAAA